MATRGNKLCHHCRHCKRFSSKGIGVFVDHVVHRHPLAATPEEFCESCPACKGLLFSRGGYTTHYASCLEKLKEELERVPAEPKDPQQSKPPKKQSFNKKVSSNAQAADDSEESDSEAASNENSEENPASLSPSLFNKYGKQSRAYAATGQIVFRCRHCDPPINFSTVHNFLEHLDQKHYHYDRFLSRFGDQEQKFDEKCPLCNIIIKAAGGFLSHFRRCFAKFQFVYEKEKEKVRSKRELNETVKDEPVEPEPKRGKRSNRSNTLTHELFPEFEQLRRTIVPWNSTGGEHRCQFCSFSTLDVLAFTNHMYTKHYENCNKFLKNCLYCRGLSFSRSNYSWHHARCLEKLKGEIRKADEADNCPVDENRTARKSSNNENQSGENAFFLDFDKKRKAFKKAGEIKHRCRHCDFEAADIGDWMDHFESKHPSVMVEFCEPCPLCNLLIFNPNRASIKSHFRACLAKFEDEVKKVEAPEKPNENKTA